MVKVVFHSNSTLPAFQALASLWRQRTKYFSSTRQITSDPAYMAIIAMGPKAIPFILRELRKRPDHWDYALMQITGHNPVPPCEAGNMRAIRRCWLQWAKVRNKRT